MAEIELRKFFARKKSQVSGQASQCEGCETPMSPAQAKDLAKRIAHLDYKPTISVVIPAYKTKKHLLSAVLNSVVRQVYAPFEVIIVDDSGAGSTLQRDIPAETLASGKIQVIDNQKNVGISDATNVGVEAARGEFIAFIDHDDELTPDALLHIAESISAKPEMDAWYSDQVTCDDAGVVLHHFLKPDWSPIYFLGCMYLGHLLVVRRSICSGIPFLRSYDGVQDYEFMLRVSEGTDRIGHVQAVLYKWRATEGSLAFAGDEKVGIGALQAAAVNEYITRKGYSWRAEEHDCLPHRVVLKPSKRTSEPRISIIIPSKNQGEIVSRCLDSIAALTNYENYELIVVDNRTTDPVALKSFRTHPIKHIIYDRKKFNYSEANNLGVEASTGDLLLFLNNDTEVLSADWLRELAMFFEDQDIGAVGPTLLYPNRKVQHAGVVLGMRGTADHVMRGFDEYLDGYAGSLPVSREVSAVTAACLMMRRSLFFDLGGFSTDYAKHYQDVDLCCRIRELGKRIISVGSTKLMHHESLSRREEGYDLGDRATFIDRWRRNLEEGDPYYNRAFVLDGADYHPRAGSF